MKQSFIFIVSITYLLTGCGVQKTTTTPSTHIPLATTIPTIYSQPTETPTPTTLAQIDLAATADAIVNWRVCDGAEIPYLKKDLSPNKKWLIVNCDPNPPSGITTTRIFRLDGSESWNVSFYEVFGKPLGMKNGQLNVIHWSNDGNYLYLSPSFCCVDAPEDIFFNYFQNSIAIYRLDLQTGKTTTTLQPFLGNIFSGYAASFSPTDKYLTYIDSNNPTEIHLNNLQTGKSKIILLDGQYNASGLLAWSSDGKKLVFVATKQSWQPYDDTQSQDSVSYFMLDIEIGTLQHLFDQKDIYKPNWTTDDKLTLNQLFGDNFLLYDFQSSSFSVITPTPYK